MSWFTTEVREEPGSRMLPLPTPPRVALVHERFTEYAGSEQVVEQLAEIWPDALVTAPVARPELMPQPFRQRVTGTGLSRLVRPTGGYAHLLPALPMAMRHLRLGSPDVVVASHHAFADQVVHATDAPVVAYVHSPARWVWDPAMRDGEAGGRTGAAMLAAFAALYRGADRNAAGRLHGIVANSRAVAERIEQWWGRPSQVVHPPVDTEFYTPDASVPREDFLLVAGRLVPYKQPGLAIQAAQRAGLRVIVAGDGRMRAQCEDLAGPGTSFLGRVSDTELRGLFRRCAALVMPGVEDFGIVPVQAQACGAPVIAARAGGALDSVLPERTGRLVELADGDPVGHWAAALRDLDPGGYDSAAIRAHAETFSRASFRDRMRQIVEHAARG